MELIFLGTSAMVPTKTRNHSGMLVKLKNERILVDCGEGTQRQLKIIGEKLGSLTKICISHLDGDHVLGLGGLLQSLDAEDYNEELLVYGPPGIKKFIADLLKLFNIRIGYTLTIKEVTSGFVFRSDELVIETRSLRHTKPTQGYRISAPDRLRVSKAKMKKMTLKPGPHIGKLVAGKTVKIDGKTIKPKDIGEIEEGKTITIIMDSMYCDEMVKLAKDADVVVCEATYLSDLEVKAKKYRHMTAEQAATVAKKGKAGRLFLTHFSARYKDAKVLEGEAKKTFSKSKAGEDLLHVEI
jgi:ribonuclease Z